MSKGTPELQHTCPQQAPAPAPELRGKLDCLSKKHALPFPSMTCRFFFYFQARVDPENAPVVLWMTGGPGCSSELAVFFENGQPGCSCRAPPGRAGPGGLPAVLPFGCTSCALRACLRAVRMHALAGLPAPFPTHTTLPGPLPPGPWPTQAPGTSTRT